MRQASSNVTLKDIARHAGVSHQTVSFVLNGKAHLFREEMRAKVLKACEELRYRPNAAARAMRAGRCRTIGLLASTRRGKSYLPDPFVSALHDALHTRDLALMYTRVDDERLVDPAFIPWIMREQTTDGLLISYSDDFPEQLHDTVEAMQIPAIWLNAGLAHNCVGPDDLAASRLLAERLLAFGHRRIAYADWMHATTQIAGEWGHFSIARRYQGYAETMQRAGLATRLLVHVPDLADYEQRPIPVDWLEAPERPTAVLFYAWPGMAAALFSARARGLTVPADLSLTTFADEPLLVEGYGMDAMVIDYASIAERAVDMLARRIAEPGLSLPAELVPFKLDVRGSVATCPPAPPH